MIRIDAIWVATEPMDMRAGTETALARVVAVFGAAASLLSTYMLLNDKHARCVIQLLTDIFADALKLAPADTLGVLGLMTNDGPCLA